MQRFLPTLLVTGILATGCSEYHVESIEKEETDWFADVEQRASPAPSSQDEQWSSDEEDDDDGEEDGTDREDDERDPPSGNDDAEDDGEDDGSDEESDDDESGDDWDDDSDDDSDDGYDWPDEEDTEPDDDSGESARPGETRDTARDPWPGEMVFTELMIDPDTVADSAGEWVEIRNTSGSWVDLSGHRLADGGVDNVEVLAVASGSLVVSPGGYAVICAEDDYWDNGGVDCDGTFRYWTFGDGFAMSNTEDEAVLISPDGLILDVVAWNEGFAAVGSAMGVEAGAVSVDANDFLDRWCDQWSWLSFGDSGTPGELNDTCW